MVLRDVPVGTQSLTVLQPSGTSSGLICNRYATGLQSIDTFNFERKFRKQGKSIFRMHSERTARVTALPSAAGHRPS
jgi:hypothetical protein